MTDLGDLRDFLHMSVTHSSDGLFLCQRQYALEILRRAGMSECHSTTTPVDTKAKLSASYAVALVRDGNSTRGCGYPRIPDPTGTGVGNNSRPRARARVKIITRGHDAGTKSRPRALPVTCIQLL
jgi:hypothetical protein